MNRKTISRWLLLGLFYTIHWCVIATMPWSSSVTMRDIHEQFCKISSFSLIPTAFVFVSQKLSPQTYEAIWFCRLFPMYHLSLPSTGTGSWHEFLELRKQSTCKAQTNMCGSNNGVSRGFLHTCFSLQDCAYTPPTTFFWGKLHAWAQRALPRGSGNRATNIVPGKWSRPGAALSPWRFSSVLVSLKMGSFSSCS